jgi:acyl dehydratase
MIGTAPPAPRTFGPVTRTDLVRYQGASGDFYPEHHDDAFAQAAGFPEVFSVGMYQAGLLVTWAVDWLGAENIRKYRARFKEQVWLGDVLTCSGEVMATTPVEGGTQVDLHLLCVRQSGSIAVEAWATFLLPN